MKFFRTAAFVSVALIALLGCAQKKPVVARDPKLELKKAENYFKHLEVEVLPEIPDRLFADISDPTSRQPAKWKEFKTAKNNVDPRGDKYFVSAESSLKGDKVLAASFYFSSPSGDWNRYADYYFWANGTLAKVESRLLTFYTQEGQPLLVIESRFYDHDGNLLQQHTSYKDAKTGKVKKEGEYFKNTLPLYKHVSELPFYYLLQKPEKRN